MSALWAYVKSKADSTYQAKGSYAAASHTHNYAGSSSAGGAANSAVKLATARTVSGGTDITMSFNYDGSANSSASIGYYSCTSSAGNTNNYPFHRIAYTGEITGSYVDKSMTLYMTQGYQGGGFGIVRVSIRTNNSSAVSSAEARWLARSGFNADQIQVALYNVYGKTYADVFFKSNGSYSGCVFRAIASDARGSITRTFTLVSSSEANDTTTSDKKTSKEVYTSIASAASSLHNNQAYTNTITASDNATVSYANSAGSANAVAWDKVTGKPSTFTPASHTHNYAGSGSAGGSANSAVKLDTATAGSATQPVYFTGGKPAACTYTLGCSVPSGAKFTDTWRGIQNNLTSDSTTDSLSAAQGKALKTLVDKKTGVSVSETTVVFA